MAGTPWRANTAAVVTGTSAKTILQVVAAANTRGRILRWGISFDGISATAVPILVEFMRQTTAGTMSALTLVKGDDSLAESLTTTAQHTATVEPTPGDVLYRTYVHPQGRYESQFPELFGGSDRVAIRVTAGASVNCVAHMSGEE